MLQIFILEYNLFYIISFQYFIDFNYNLEVEEN